jgi:hypothetical protein
MSKDLKLSKEGIELANQAGKELAELVAKQLSEREELALIEQETLKLERNRGKLLPTLPNAMIPENVFIQCPAKYPKLIRVQRCRSCEYFGGVTLNVVSTPGKQLDPRIPWEVKHGIQCKHPTDRRCILMEIE